MSRREEVTQAIYRILTDEVPQIPWRVLVKGLSRGKGTEGSISCDNVQYTRDAKDMRQARAFYTIAAIAGSDGDDIDVIADAVDLSLMKNPTLDNWATDARITEILYGVAQGFPDQPVMFMATLRVDYDSD